MRVKASELNVRSGPGTEYRVLGKLTQGAEVAVQEKHGDWSYVEPGRGWVHSSYLEAPAPAASAFDRPTGLAGIKAAYGEPGNPMCTAGKVPLPSPLRLGWEDRQVTSFRCHAKAATPFTRAFARIHEEGLWGELETFDGCYAERKQRGTTEKLSTHNWGISVDLNAGKNELGTKGAMHPRVVEIFEEEGFEWGGNWKRPDPMHFQLADGY